MTAQPPSGLFDSLFDSDGTIFMGSRRNPADCRVGLFGVPYEAPPPFALAPASAPPPSER